VETQRELKRVSAREFMADDIEEGNDSVH